MNGSSQARVRTVCWRPFASVRTPHITSTPLSHPPPEASVPFRSLSAPRRCCPATVFRLRFPVSLLRSAHEARCEMRAPAQQAVELPRLDRLEQARQPWELPDDSAKYLWRLSDTNNLNACCEPRNASGDKVYGGPVPPLGSV